MEKIEHSSKEKKEMALTVELSSMKDKNFRSEELQTMELFPRTEIRKTGSPSRLGVYNAGRSESNLKDGDRSPSLQSSEKEGASTQSGRCSSKDDTTPTPKKLKRQKSHKYEPRTSSARMFQESRSPLDNEFRMNLVSHQSNGGTSSGFPLTEVLLKHRDSISNPLLLLEQSHSPSKQQSSFHESKSQIQSSLRRAGSLKSIERLNESRARGSSLGLLDLNEAPNSEQAGVSLSLGVGTSQDHSARFASAENRGEKRLKLEQHLPPSSSGDFSLSAGLAKLLEARSSSFDRRPSFRSGMEASGSPLTSKWSEFKTPGKLDFVHDSSILQNTNEQESSLDSLRSGFKRPPNRFSSMETLSEKLRQLRKKEEEDLSSFLNVRRSLSGIGLKPGLQIPPTFDEGKNYKPQEISELSNLLNILNRGASQSVSDRRHESLQRATSDSLFSPGSQSHIQSPLMQSSLSLIGQNTGGSESSRAESVLLDGLRSSIVNLLAGSSSSDPAANPFPSFPTHNIGSSRSASISPESLGSITISMKKDGIPITSEDVSYATAFEILRVINNSKTAANQSVPPVSLPTQQLPVQPFSTTGQFSPPAAVAAMAEPRAGNPIGPQRSTANAEERAEILERYRKKKRTQNRETGRKNNPSKKQKKGKGEQKDPAPCNE